MRTRALIYSNMVIKIKQGDKKEEMIAQMNFCWRKNNKKILEDNEILLKPEGQKNLHEKVVPLQILLIINLIDI